MKSSNKILIRNQSQEQNILKYKVHLSMDHLLDAYL